MCKDTKGMKAFSGELDDMVSSLFRAILNTSKLGVNNDPTFIKQTSKVLKFISDIDDSKCVESVSEFMHLIFKYRDLKACKTYEIYLNGVTDELTAIEWIDNDINPVSGFGITCFICPIYNKNTCIAAWKEDDGEDHISNSKLLGLLAEYGFDMPECVTEEIDIVSKTAVCINIAMAIFSELSKEACIPSAIKVSSIAKGLRNILTMDIESGESYPPKSLTFIIRLVNAKSKIMYTVCMDDDKKIHTIYKEDEDLTIDILECDLYISYVSISEGNIGSFGISFKDFTNDTITLNDIVDAMAEILESQEESSI